MMNGKVVKKANIYWVGNLQLAVVFLTLESVSVGKKQHFNGVA